MRIYAKAAIAAHEIIIKDSLTPLDAWNKAISAVTASPTSRTKGCPRTTFLALVESGYLKGIDIKNPGKRKGILYERAIAAAELVLANPEATHRYISDNLEYCDKQGAYDIVIELAGNGILQAVKKYNYNR